MNKNQPKRSNAIHNDQYFLNQAHFDNPFNSRRSFIYLDISKMSFTFKYLEEFQVAYQKRQLKRLN